MLMKKLTWEGSYASIGPVRALAFSDSYGTVCIARQPPLPTLHLYFTPQPRIRYVIWTRAISYKEHLIATAAAAVLVSLYIIVLDCDYSYLLLSSFFAH